MEASEARANRRGKACPQSGNAPSSSARDLLARATRDLSETPGADPIFFTRLGDRYETIFSLFAQLYGQTKDFFNLFGRLESLLLECYRVRPAKLKTIDVEWELALPGRALERRGPWYLEPGLAAGLAGSAFGRPRRIGKRGAGSRPLRTRVDRMSIAAGAARG